MRQIILPVIREHHEDYEELEEAISRFFRQEIYYPLLEELGVRDLRSIQNAREEDLDILARALASGQLRFYRGVFTGRLSSKISRGLRSLGAKWDVRQGSFRIPHRDLPPQIQIAIGASEAKFERVVRSMTEQLKDVSPEQVAARLDLTPYFDRSIFRVGKDIADSLTAIKVEPQLSKIARRRLAEEYGQTLYLPIQDFLKKETEALRLRITQHAFAGGRYETLAKEIQASYGVSQRKAKFLARQETSLLMAKFKQVRYEEAGSEGYFWGCVKMPHQQKGQPYQPGCVRYYHAKNEGKYFSWREGAVVNDKGERKHPGQDYGCRCFPRVAMRFY